MMVMTMGNDAGSAVTASGEIHALHDLTGLSWSQMGRLFGVPQRVVRSWALGMSIPNRYEKRLEHIVTVISTATPIMIPVADGDENNSIVASNSTMSPSEVRRELLDDGNGGSIFHQLESEVRHDRINWEPLSPRELIES